MIKFRQLPDELFKNPRYQELGNLEQADAMSVLNYSLVGNQARDHRVLTGIYKIPVQGWRVWGLNEKKTVTALEYLNKNFNDLFQYDFINQIAFSKLFLDINAGYRPSTTAINDIKENYERTFEIAAPFWWELSHINKVYLRKLQQLVKKDLEAAKDDIIKSQHQDKFKFINDIVNLKDINLKELPKTKISFVSIKKLKK